MVAKVYPTLGFGFVELIGSELAKGCFQSPPSLRQDVMVGFEVDVIHVLSNVIVSACLS